MDKLKATHVGPRTHPPYVLSRELHVKQNAKREKILSFHKPNRLHVGLGDPSHLLSSWQVSFATGQKMLKEKRVLSFCYFSVSLCYTRPNRQSSKLLLKSSLPHDLAFIPNGFICCRIIGSGFKVCEGDDLGRIAWSEVDI